MNATAYCKLVEARLGWKPPEIDPQPRGTGRPWARDLEYRAEAGKVNRKVKTNPALYTWNNLVLAVELLAKERRERTPIGVFSHVERALDLAMDQEPDVEHQIRAAVEYELQRGDKDGWTARFARAQGAYRIEALEEWRAARGIQGP